MEQDYDACERFLNELEEYLHAYEIYLSNTLKKLTVNKHVVVVHTWCEYIAGYKYLTDFSTLTVSLVNSKFHNHYKWNRFDDMSNAALSNIIKKFLFFVYDHYGIANIKLLEKLK